MHINHGLPSQGFFELISPLALKALETQRAQSLQVNGAPSFSVCVVGWDSQQFRRMNEWTVLKFDLRFGGIGPWSTEGLGQLDSPVSCQIFYLTYSRTAQNGTWHRDSMWEFVTLRVLSHWQAPGQPEVQLASSLIWLHSTSSLYGAYGRLTTNKYVSSNSSPRSLLL